MATDRGTHAPPERPDGRPAHVMHLRARTAGHLAGVLPGGAEVTDALAVPVEHERADRAGRLHQDKVIADGFFGVAWYVDGLRPLSAGTGHGIASNMFRNTCRRGTRSRISGCCS